MRNVVMVVSVILLALSLQACDSGGLKITVQYPDDPGIVNGDRVLENDETVGVVTDVKAAGGKTQLLVAIKPETGKSITDRTRFYIDDDPEKSGRKAIRLERATQPGKPIASGAVVEGADKSMEMLHRFKDSLEAGAQGFVDQFKSFLDQMEKAPESDAVQQLKEDLEALAESFNRSAKEAQDKIRREVLPQLEQYLDELRRELEALGREDEVTELRYELDQMKKM